jgi:hypothetical protein
MTGIPYLDTIERDLIEATLSTRARRPGRFGGFAAAFAITVAAFVGVAFLGGEQRGPFGASELEPGTPLPDADLVVFIDAARPGAVDEVRQELSTSGDVRTFVFFDQEAAFAEFQSLFAGLDFVDTVDQHALPLSIRAETDGDPNDSLIRALESKDGVTAVRSRPAAGVCEVTVPPNPGFTPPDSHRPTPGEGRVWYGSDALWTVLETDGSHGPRKSVWWSANFPGGTVEERPEITVTYERLDAPLSTPLVVGGPGTNAHTGADGWFMIAGGEPREPGCWKATARYKGATLSYTYFVED